MTRLGQRAGAAHAVATPLAEHGIDLDQLNDELVGSQPGRSKPESEDALVMRCAMILRIITISRSIGESSRTPRTHPFVVGSAPDGGWPSFIASMECEVGRGLSRRPGSG